MFGIPMIGMSAAQIVQQAHQQGISNYAELQAASERKEFAKEFACLRCKWGSGNGGEHQKCRNPLIIGFDREFVWAWDCQDGTHMRAALCGAEKALWEPRPPKLTLWQRFINWLFAEPPQDA